MGEHERSLRAPTPQQTNSAIRRGRSDLGAATLVTLFLTATMGFLWLSLFDADSRVFDLPHRLTLFGEQIGLVVGSDPPPESTPAPAPAPTSAPTPAPAPASAADPSIAIGLLGGFGAIAIASVVALGGAVRQLELLRTSQPALDPGPHSPVRAREVSPPLRDEDPALEWLRRRSAAQAVTFVELMLPLLSAAFALITTASLALAGLQVLSIAAGLLTGFLIIESIRFLMALVSLQQLQLEPIPEQIADRLNRLASPSVLRTITLFARRLLGIAAVGATIGVFTTENEDGDGIVVALVMVGLAGIAMAAAGAAREALTEFGPGRYLTVTIFAFLPLAVLGIPYGSAVASLASSTGRDDLGWWGLGVLALLLVLLIVRVLDAAGIPAATSGAVIRRASLLPPPPRRQGDRVAASLGFLLAVSTLSVVPYGFSHPAGAVSGALILLGLPLLAVVRWSRWGLRLLVSAGVLLVLALLTVAGVLLGGDTTSPALWGGYAMLLACTVLAVSSRPTRSGLLLTAAVDAAMSATRHRTAVQWRRRLNRVGVVEESGNESPRYRAITQTVHAVLPAPTSRSFHPHLLDHPHPPGRPHPLDHPHPLGRLRPPDAEGPPPMESGPAFPPLRQSATPPE
ncbi:hypothetical protein J2Y69_001640 [Microbacterium resistens]|uniref:ABC-2 type transport system permease protein n=1 Tax=Microbacterium resistens TaxID=156977 RepID=A0ABU1SBS8_9MICO|nr:hypothetical protein [Microbacterium resistens]MDR6867041.1 hypothetical protein [Microbacterium resistens]